MEGGKERIDIQAVAGIVQLFFKSIGDGCGGTVFLVDLEFLDLEAFVGFEFVQISVFRIEVVIMGLDRVGSQADG